MHEISEVRRATGLTVSAIGLGAWQLGNAKDWNGPGERESPAIIGAALEAGITFFDPAPNYAAGRSGELLGRGLRGHRDEVVLCTKFGHTPEGRTEQPGRWLSWQCPAQTFRQGADVRARVRR